MKYMKTTSDYRIHKDSDDFCALANTTSIHFKIGSRAALVDGEKRVMGGLIRLQKLFTLMVIHECDTHS